MTTSEILAQADLTREIERKFLLRDLPERLERLPHSVIEQGYLALERESGVQVRLRRRGARCSLTFKRGTRHAREEREIQLSPEQFEALWPATDGRRLSKIRYDVAWKEHTIEIDVYTGRHDGMVVAEVEFADEKSCTTFVPPEWFGEEVTGDARYSNVVLAIT